MISLRSACRLLLLSAAAAALGACTTDGKGQVSLLSPMTHQRASMQKVDLDKRVDVVNRCIDEKMSGRA
jgi:hypothetical protein